jgi:indolepyruvate decarboxylase
MADGNFESMMNCYREFTVAQARIEPLNAAGRIDSVLRACWLERRPVYLQLPSDVAGVAVDPPQKPLDLNFPRSDPRQIARAVSVISERLLQARCPAILVGADADRYDLMESITALAEARNIPIAHLIPAKGAMSYCHALSIGIYRGAASSPDVQSAVEDSDCLFCVGTRFTDVASGFFTHTINPESVIDLQPFSVRFQGEFFCAVAAKDFLSGVLARVVPTTSTPLPQRPVRAPRSEAVTSWPVTQVVFWQYIQNFLRERDVVAVDTGSAFFSSANLMLPEGVSFIAQPIWGSLGYALPAVLGTCLAAPGRRQFAFLGDGAFQITVQELSTILRLNLKPIIFLINNDGYTMERLIFVMGTGYTRALEPNRLTTTSARGVTAEWRRSST